MIYFILFSIVAERLNGRKAPTAEEVELSCVGDATVKKPTGGSGRSEVPAEISKDLQKLKVQLTTLINKLQPGSVSSPPACAADDDDDAAPYPKYIDGTRTTVCPYCKLVFNEYPKLADHVDYHRGIKRHQCLSCEASFSNRHSWWLHMDLHEKKDKGAEVFPCRKTSKCNKVCTTQVQLDAHYVNQHPDKSLPPGYHCPHCNKAFWVNYYMLAHLRLASCPNFTPVPSTCTVCSKVFKSYAKMRVHYNNQHGTRAKARLLKKFVCGICHVSLDTKVSYNQHMRYIHKAKPLPKKK